MSFMDATVLQAETLKTHGAVPFPCNIRSRLLLGNLQSFGFKLGGGGGSAGVFANNEKRENPIIREHIFISRNH